MLLPCPFFKNIIYHIPIEKNLMNSMVPTMEPLVVLLSVISKNFDKFELKVRFGSIKAREGF